MPIGKVTVGEECEGLRNHPDRRFFVLARRGRRAAPRNPATSTPNENPEPHGSKDGSN